MEKQQTFDSTKHINPHATREELIQLKATLLDLIKVMPSMESTVNPMLAEIVKPLREKKLANIKAEWLIYDTAAKHLSLLQNTYRKRLKRLVTDGFQSA